MITVFGYPINLPPPLDHLDSIFATFLITAIAWIVIGLLVYLILTYVLKAIARRLPGEVEDTLLGIIRKPIIILLFSFGLVNTLETLPLTPAFIEFLEKLLQTILILVVLYLLWRLIKDVIVYYGKGWARKTESKFDDNLIPILNIFGPFNDCNYRRDDGVTYVGFRHQFCPGRRGSDWLDPWSGSPG